MNNERSTPDLDRKKKQTIILGWTLGIALVLFFVFTNALLVYIGVIGTQTRDSIADCVQPNGECARRNQEATADVVDSLTKDNRLSELATQRIVVITENCGKQPRIKRETDPGLRLQLLQECVDGVLKADKE